MAKARTKTAPAKASADKTEAPVATGTELVPHLKAGALSLDVGPVVVAALAERNQMKNQSFELAKSARNKTYETQSAMCAAIVKAAKADDTIDLSVVFGGSKSDKVKLNKQLYFAMGLQTVQMVIPKKGGTAKPQIVWTEHVAPFMPSEADKSDPGLYRQKDTVRSNLSHLMTLMTQTAAGIIRDKVSVKKDKESGTLLLSGPAMKQHFGQADVLLNEKQTVVTKDKKGSVIGEAKLKAKPSFTEIARRAAEAHGVVHAKRVDSRSVAVDPNTHIANLCNTLVKALEKFTGELSAEARKALDAAASAIDVAIA